MKFCYPGGWVNCLDKFENWIAKNFSKVLQQGDQNVGKNEFSLVATRM